METKEPPDSEDWDAQRNEETIRLAFEESQSLYPLYGDYVDALDRKTTAVFGIASAIIGLAPAVQWGAHLVGLPRYAWFAAVGAWIVVVGVCHRVYRPRDFRFGPDPGGLRVAAWTHLTPTEYRYFRLRDMGTTFAANRAEIMRKADLLRIAAGFAVLEVVLLLVAFLAAHLA